MSNINISGIDKAELLAELFNASNQHGLGFLNLSGKSGMTQEEAEAEIEQAKRYSSKGRIEFDYLRGRVMKVDISGDELYPGLYDRDNGNGSCDRIVKRIRERMVVK